MKRILSLTLALVMVLGTFTGVFAAEPTVEEAAGKFLESVGVLLGDDEGNLNLNENLERRDAVILLSRLLGAEEVAAEFPKSEESPSWTDVRTDEYYVSFFAWAEANGYFEGNDDNTFAPREAISAPEYALVLLRALGYEANGYESWKAALKTAKELGLLEDVEVEFEDKVVRGQMAVMTLNALGTKVKDSEKTLAETLEIELPVPAVLEVEEVKAENLKEIQVVFNKAVDAEVATNVDNYDTNAGDIEYVTYLESKNTAVLTLEGTMKDKKEYELTIEGIEDINVKKEFTAIDNAIPEVVEVIGLGTKAVKVVMSEPVKTAKTTNFRLNGKAVYGTVDVAGRDIILKGYSDLSVGEHELTIRSLEDFAGFKSLEVIHTFEVVEDKDAPTVVEVTAPALEKLIVTFDEDVDSTTVNTKTVYYKDRGTKIYPSEVKALAGNKYAFTFSGDNGLPLYETTIYIEGVKDYSGNKMTATEVAVKASIDETRPEVKEVTISVDRKTITVAFTKLVNLTDAKFTVLDKDDNKLAISSINPTDAKTKTKSVEIVLGKALKANEEYTLKITEVKDTNKYPNYMADYSGKISTADLGQPTLGPVAIREIFEDDDEVVYSISVFFNKVMDLATISNPDNYLVEVDNANRLLSKLDNEIEIKDVDGKKVEIRITVKKDTNGNYVNITGIAGLDIKGANEKGLTNYGKIERPDNLDFVNATAVAKSNDTVEVTFNKEIKTAPKSAFQITGLEIDSAKIDGKVVTLKLVDRKDNKLPADMLETSLSIVSEKVVSYDGKEYGKNGEELQISIKDEIAPTLKKVTTSVTTGGAVELTLEFDEDLTTDTALSTTAWVDLKVVRVEGMKTMTLGNAVREGKKLTFTIAADQAELDSDYLVTIKNAKVIKDREGNVAADVENVRTESKTVGVDAKVAVEKAEESRTQADVDAAKALVNKLPAGSLKVALQERIDAITIA